ncbi:MaoC family dehydratase [Sphingomicrobium sp. XHP0239]|uniref:MaoC family dehydratase n=1 Tax=Sphingomicrobium maritimum TaxID=3133972 RepID=UPI0031CCA8B5
MSDDRVFWEDIDVGRIDRFGAYKVTREEVIDFASAYDPQPFHLDDAAAEASLFGKLSASGWHTGAMAMRMLVDRMAPQKIASLGSPGIDDLKWLTPVYPGDTLRLETEVLEKRPMNSRSDVGLHKTRTSVFNQDDVEVMRFTSNVMTRRRPA